jgi:hypothetical protein
VEFTVYRALLIILIAAAGCSSTGGTAKHTEGEPSGQAIDIDTGLPVADAYIVIHYSAAPSIFVFPILPHGESGGCHSFVYAVTGQDGFYYASSVADRPTNWLVYKKGYKVVAPPGLIERRLEAVGSQEEVRYQVYPRDPAFTFGMREGTYTTERAAQRAAGWDNFYLRPFTGTATERLKDLSNVFFRADCMWSRENRKNIVPFLAMIYLEAKSLPESAKEMEIVRGMARDIEQQKTAR